MKRIDGHVHFIGESMDRFLDTLVARDVGQAIVVTRNWVLRPEHANELRLAGRKRGIYLTIGSEFYLEPHSGFKISVLAAGYDETNTGLRYVAGESEEYLAHLRERASRYLETLVELGYNLNPERQEQLDWLTSAKIPQPTECHVELIKEICLAENNRERLAKELGLAHKAGELSRADMARVNAWYHCREEAAPSVPPCLVAGLQKLLFRRYFGPGKPCYQGRPREFEINELRQAIHNAGGKALLSLENPGDYTTPWLLGLDGIAISTLGWKFNCHPESGLPLLEESELKNFPVIAGSDYQGLNRPPGIDRNILPEPVLSFFNDVTGFKPAAV